MENSFLYTTARSILSQIDWRRLNRTTLVLPSHRAGLVLKDHLLRLQEQSDAQAVWAPQVVTLPQLQDSLSPLYAEDELMTVIRLYRLYRAAVTDDPMPLDVFYGWGRQMIADFTNIDASMPASEVPNFFDNTIAAHELSTWHLDPEVESRLRSLINPEAAAHTAADDSIRAQYETLWRQLYDFYRSLRAQMQAEQKGYPGMRQRAVIEHWSDPSVQKQIEGRTYIFVGFNYLLPVERELMTLLRDGGQALFFWDYIPDFKTNEKAFSFAELNSRLLGSAQPTIDNSQFTIHNSQLPITVISTVSRASQAQFVHRWLQENYTAAGQKVGVVICDETMLEPVIYALPPIVLSGETEPAPINITKGFPLRNTAVCSRVLAWLADRKNGLPEDPVTPETIDRLIAGVLDAQEGQTCVSSQQSQEAGDSLSWQELLILESEYQVRKILNQLRQIISAGPDDMPFTVKLLRLLLRRTMESVTMPFHGEPVTDVQIMGVLETRLMDFDKLLILNVEEGVIPQRQQDSSFIPFYLRKAFHMQTSDERATVYAYNFFRLLSRSGETTLLYASAETAEGGKGPSRFILQLLYSPEFEVHVSCLEEPSVLDTSPREIAEEGGFRSLLSTLREEQGLLVRTDGRPFILSPSALNTYISCPRSFYLRYVLGMRPKEKEEVLFAPNTLGSFVHLVMEYIYRTYLHCDGVHPTPVTPEAIEAVRTDEARLQEALMAAYGIMNSDPENPNRYIPEQHTGENVIIAGYVRNILERDAEDARTGLQIVLLEADRRFRVHLDGIGDVFTGGTIDRLDIAGPPEAPVMRVVDYKSGSYSDSTHAKKMSSSREELMESEEKGYVRQTLIYAHAVLSTDHPQMPVEPNLFFCRRRLTDITTTIDLEGTAVSDYAAVRDTFYESLQSKIAQILTTTSFPPCEEDKCPAFCPFFDLCGRTPKEY